MLLEVEYSWSLYDVKGGPLSGTILFGMPYKLKNCSSAKITFLAEVLLINSTSGYFMHWLIIANIYWPFRNGPKNLDCVSCDINLCQSYDGVTDLQEVQRPNTCLVILSMFGKNTLDLSSALVFVSPKCPAWAKFTAKFQ